MCLIAFQYQKHPDYPLIFVENRDETYQRPSAPIQQWEDEPQIFGGRDLKQLGTWLGVTECGRLGALTNHPFTDFTTARAPISRGALVSNWLLSTQDALVYGKELRENRFNYDTYHLLYGDLEELYIYENYDDSLQKLAPGIHTLSNTQDELSSFKEARAQQKLTEYLTTTAVPTVDDLIALFFDSTEIDNITDYPSDIISKEMAARGSAMFIKDAIRGTVNTTAIIIDKQGHVQMKEIQYGPHGEEQHPAELTFKIK